MSDEETRAEVARLGRELREARVATGRSVRALAGSAGVAPSTVVRIEGGHVAGTFATAARMAYCCGARIGVAPAGEAVPGDSWAPPPGWWGPDRFAMALRAVRAGRQLSELDLVACAQLQFVGAELWWARQHELEPPLTAREAAALLGMTRQTLRRIEHGEEAPALEPLVRAAALTGRRIGLVGATAPRRRWPSP